MQLYQKKLNLSKIELNVKDVDTSSRTVTLYSAVFDNKDRDNDVIVKGAFKKTLQEQGPAGINEIWHLLKHDPNQEVARPFEINEDSYGLLSRVKMPNTTRGNDTLEMYQTGNYKHHSIGYRVVRAQPRKDYNELQELQLFENSTVLWAANPSATVVDVKSFMTPKQIRDEISITMKSIRNGKFSDETFALLEIKLYQLMQAAADHELSTQAAIVAPEPQEEKGVDAEYARMKFKLLTAI